MEINWNDAKALAKERSRWRKLVARCPKSISSMSQKYQEELSLS